MSAYPPTADMRADIALRRDGPMLSKKASISIVMSLEALLSVGNFVVSV
jgi:hypothetical protein